MPVRLTADFTSFRTLRYNTEEHRMNRTCTRFIGSTGKIADATWGVMGARSMRFSTDQNGRAPFVLRGFERFLIAALPIRFSCLSSSEFTAGCAQNFPRASFAASVCDVSADSIAGVAGCVTASSAISRGAISRCSIAGCGGRAEVLAAAELLASSKVAGAGRIAGRLLGHRWKRLRGRAVRPIGLRR